MFVCLCKYVYTCVYIHESVCGWPEVYIGCLSLSPSNVYFEIMSIVELSLPAWPVSKFASTILGLPAQHWGTAVCHHTIPEFLRGLWDLHSRTLSCEPFQQPIKGHFKIPFLVANNWIRTFKKRNTSY